MGYESPNVNLIDINGNSLSIQNGVAIPASTPSIIISGSDGTNARYLSLDSSGRVILVGAGTAGTPAGGVLSIQGVAGGIAVPISDNAGSLTVDNPILSVVGGGAEATAQRVTIANDSTGVLSIDDNGGSLTVDGTVTSNQGTANSLANAWSMKITDATNGPVGVAPANTSATTAQPALVVAISPNTLPQTPADNNATATIVALNGTVIGTTGGCSTIIFDITGTWSATLIFEGQSGDGNWVGLQCYSVTNKSLITSATTNQMVMIQCGGFPQVRARASTFASGTASLTWNAGSGNNFNTVGIGQGNSIAAVKAASTAPIATDQALVVVLSPNQPAIPTTNAPSTSVPHVSTGDIILSSATTSVIRRTTYTEQTTNFTGSIASANAADAAAGTGARTVKIYYVDATGATAGTETATLNGTTGVNLVTTTKCFIEKIEVLTAGSGGANAGIISLYTGAAKAGTVVGTIAAGDNVTFWAHHYVVTGDVCNVTGVYHGNNSTVSGGVSVAVLKAKDLSNAASVEKQVSDFIGVAGAANPFTRIYGSVVQVAGPSRLLMYVTSGSATSITYRGSFDSYDS